MKFIQLERNHFINVAAILEVTFYEDPKTRKIEDPNDPREREIIGSEWRASIRPLNGEDFTIQGEAADSLRSFIISGTNRPQERESLTTFLLPYVGSRISQSLSLEGRTSMIFMPVSFLSWFPKLDVFLICKFEFGCLLRAIWTKNIG